MIIARRIYIYLVTFISLLMLLAGASSLIRLGLEALFGLQRESFIYGENFMREQLSINGALLVVGGIVWAIHWFLAQRSVRPSNANAVSERAAVLRKLLIYAVLFTTLAYISFAVGGLLNSVLGALPDVGTDEVKLALGSAVGNVLVYGIAWLYYWWVRNADNAKTPEEKRPATVRRWYFYLANYVALSVFVFAFANIGRYVWRIVTTAERPWLVDPNWVPLEIAGSIAACLTAGTVWILHWLPTQRLVAQSQPEQHSILRRVYLYGMLLQVIAVTLTSTAMFLFNLLRFFWGTDPVAGTGDSLLTAAGGPVVTALVYGVFWAYHWWIMGQEKVLVAYEPPLQATLGRLYHSLVALVGGAILSVGIASMLRTLFDLWLGGPTITDSSRQAWGDQISLFTSAILVGGPVWFITWLNLQRRALSPDGVEERQSLVRRVYLYVVLFLSIVALLSGAATLVYQLFRHLGETFDSAIISQMSWAIGDTITAGALLAYHLFVLLGDQRAKPAVQAPVYVPSVAATDGLTVAPFEALMFIAGGSAVDLDAASATLQKELPADDTVEVLPAAGVNLVELKAWLTEHTVPPSAPEAPTAPAPTLPPADLPKGVTPVPV